MENYSYSASYPNSGDSSPRSREIDFEKSSPWEDQPQFTSSKLKFMCSYGGKIHPRPHDNQLSYVGGETKILALDRSINFSAMITRLSSLCDADVSFKYQLPGEDLDALISVTNDDDLDHMIQEFDRLSRVSPKSARLRLFLFPANQQSKFASDEVKSEKERFVDALNSGPIRTSLPSPTNHGDFLFGLDQGISIPPVANKLQNQVPDSAARLTEFQLPEPSGRAVGLDSIQAQINELQRLQIRGPEQAIHGVKSDENLIGGFAGDHYYQKIPEKVLPATMPSAVAVPAGYWPEKQTVGGAFPPSKIGAEQPVYMISAPPASVYHAPMGRPVTAPVTQGYYAVQRMPPEIYREQAMYNMVPPMAAVPSPATASQTFTKAVAYSDGVGMGRPSPNHGGMGVNDTGYTQGAYDNGMGRQVFYTAPGGVVAPTPYQAMAAAAGNSDMRAAGSADSRG